MNFGVNENYAVDKVERCSKIGILIYLNMSLTPLYSKRQNTVESSTFVSEYVTTKIAVERLESMRYKLHLIGVPQDGPAYDFANNQSVVKKSINLESVLNKKSVNIYNHITQETFTAKIVDIYFIPSEENLVDLQTKFLQT